jgi:hypothetical protein
VVFFLIFIDNFISSPAIAFCCQQNIFFAQNFLYGIYLLNPASAYDHASSTGPPIPDNGNRTVSEMLWFEKTSQSREQSPK